MKLFRRLFTFMLLAGAIVAGVVLAHNKKTQVEKMEMKSKGAAISVENAVKDSAIAGERISSELATEAVTKAEVAASNIVTSATNETTEAMNQARQKLEHAVN